MKKIRVKPVEDILIQFTDREYKCTFNMLSIAYLQTELGKIEEKITDISPAHMAALILYSGVKANHPEFTVEDANALALQIGPGGYGDIVGTFYETVFESLDEGGKTLLKKMIAQQAASAVMK